MAVHSSAWESAGSGPSTTVGEMASLAGISSIRSAGEDTTRTSTTRCFACSIRTSIGRCCTQSRGLFFPALAITTGVSATTPPGGGRTSPRPGRRFVTPTCCSWIPTTGSRCGAFLMARGVGEVSLLARGRRSLWARPLARHLPALPSHGAECIRQGPGQRAPAASRRRSRRALADGECGVFHRRPSGAWGAVAEGLRSGAPSMERSVSCLSVSGSGTGAHDDGAIGTLPTNWSTIRAGRLASSSGQGKHPFTPGGAHEHVTVDRSAAAPPPVQPFRRQCPGHPNDGALLLRCDGFHRH